MESPHDDNHVELRQVTVLTTPESPSCHGNPSFTMDIENSKGPPPYIGPRGGGTVHRNGDMIFANEGTDTPRSTSPVPECFTNGDVKNGDMNKSCSLLSVRQDTRRRHKSEGATPNTPRKSFLEPNNRKGSIYESKSTLSGAKFDDSFIGKSNNCHTSFSNRSDIEVRPSCSKCHLLNELVSGQNVNSSSMYNI